MEVDYDIFVQAEAPEEARTYQPSDYDLRLSRNAKCIDAGVALPQVTDNFNGAGPDLGCYEFDQPVPHYGPRK
jgi:hypothetical protein